MRSIVRVTVSSHDRPSDRLLAPVGIATPYETPTDFSVSGGCFDMIGEATTGQMAAIITPNTGGDVVLTYVYREPGTIYPEPMFTPRSNRFTRAAASLAGEALRIASDARGGHAAISAIVADTMSKFRYGHPETRFNDGCADVPYLACGLTEGSCVDINTYLIAALRAAGLEAGYVTGYFFPAEKNGRCDDAHCWVVTRHEGAVLEWDIAHHLKLGARHVASGLNPKPGFRLALAHSMGLDFPELGLEAMKLLSEPVWLSDQGAIQRARLSIELLRDSAAAAPFARQSAVVTAKAS